MLTEDGSFQEVPSGKAIYFVAYRELETGRVLTKTACVNEVDGPDEALKIAMHDATAGETFPDSAAMAEEFWKDFRVQSIRRECPSAA